MQKENEYKQGIARAKKNIDKVKSELHLFNCLIEARPNILQLERGRALKDKIYSLYEQGIAREKQSIDFYQRLLNDENVSINFSLK